MGHVQALATGQETKIHVICLSNDANTAMFCFPGFGDDGGPRKLNLANIDCTVHTILCVFSRCSRTSIEKSQSKSTDPGRETLPQVPRAILYPHALGVVASTLCLTICAARSCTSVPHTLPVLIVPCLNRSGSFFYHQQLLFPTYSFQFLRCLSCPVSPRPLCWPPEPMSPAL